MHGRCLENCSPSLDATHQHDFDPQHELLALRIQAQIAEFSIRVVPTKAVAPALHSPSLMPKRFSRKDKPPDKNKYDRSEIVCKHKDSVLYRAEGEFA